MTTAMGVPVGAALDFFLRTADAVHLVTAHETGELEVWTNDRRTLAAASHFGLVEDGR